MKNNNDFFNIGEFAKKVFISKTCARNYEKKGLINCTRDPVNGYRVYTMEDVENFLKKVGRWKEPN
jgi:DNA-binding transcriptional MerR regulator